MVARRKLRLSVQRGKRALEDFLDGATLGERLCLDPWAYEHLTAPGLALFHAVEGRGCARASRTNGSQCVIVKNAVPTTGPRRGLPFGGAGSPGAGAGAGPYSGVKPYATWRFSSTAIVRTPGIVFTVATSE